MLKISRFRFSSTAIAEVVAIVVLFPIGLSLWVSGLGKMKYSLNFQQAIEQYGCKNFTEANDAIANAEEAEFENPTALNLFKANLLTEKGYFEEALRAYESAEQHFLASESQIADARVGKAVCSLHLLAQGKSFSSSSVQKLQSEIRNLAEKEKNPDAMVLLGHANLTLGDFYASQKNHEPARSNFLSAQSSFRAAEKLHAPGKSALSRGACLSLFLGKGIAFYRTAQMERSPSERLNFLKNSVDCLRQALSFQLPRTDVFPVMGRIHLEALKMELSEEERAGWQQRSRELMEFAVRTRSTPPYRGIASEFDQSWKPVAQVLEKRIR